MNYHLFQIYFNIATKRPPILTLFEGEKLVSGSLFLKNFTLIFLLCDTCDSKKSKSLWMRVRATRA